MYVNNFMYINSEYHTQKKEAQFLPELSQEAYYKRKIQVKLLRLRLRLRKEMEAQSAQCLIAASRNMNPTEI